MNNIIYYCTPYKRKKHLGGEIMCNILEKIRNKNPYELFDEYHIQLTLPINISLLLDEIGISVIAKDFTNIENECNFSPGSILGAALSKEESLAIFYRKSDTLHRKKFTIAHELAHCCFDCPENETSHIELRLEPFINLTENELQKERRANIFAGQLLMPKDILLSHYNNMIIPSLTELAKIFEVSTSAMAARLDYLKKPYYKDSITEIII